MSSSSKNQKQILRKVISKQKNSDCSSINASHRMTRFKSKAKDCNICYSSIETQVFKSNLLSYKNVRVCSILVNMIFASNVSKNGLKLKIVVHYVNKDSLDSKKYGIE